MSNISVVPFGPQHPVLPEPIHLDLVIEDEKVIEAVPSIGFVHRGLESLIVKKDFNEMVYVAERTCGICSFGHGMGYVEAVEKIMNVQIPDRAGYLRTIWMELSRMHSHLLWLGLLADAFGYESLFYHCWRIREQVLDMIEESTGGRVIFSVNKVGGVMKDMDTEMLARFSEKLGDVEDQVITVRKTFLGDRTVQLRLRGVGVLTRQQAHDLGCVGPFGRASGIASDLRTRGYGAYGNLDFEPVTSDEGDSFARCRCRIEEILQSIDLIRQAMSTMPGGDISVPVKGNPDGEYFMRIEQPRGEAVYYVKGTGKPYLNRLRIRTPTFANLPGLCETLKGADYADVPILILTIDPCISCTER